MGLKCQFALNQGHRGCGQVHEIKEGDWDG